MRPPERPSFSHRCLSRGASLSVVLGHLMRSPRDACCSQAAGLPASGLLPSGLGAATPPRVNFAATRPENGAGCATTATVRRRAPPGSAPSRCRARAPLCPSGPAAPATGWEPGSYYTHSIRVANSWDRQALVGLSHRMLATARTNHSAAEAGRALS